MHAGQVLDRAASHAVWCWPPRAAAHTGARSCSNLVASIWSSCLQRCVLGCLEGGQRLPPGAPRDMPVGRLQLAEVVEMLQVCVCVGGGGAVAEAAALGAVVGCRHLALAHPATQCPCATQDIRSTRMQQLGAAHPQAAEVHLLACLALSSLQQVQRAQQELHAARHALQLADAGAAAPAEQPQAAGGVAAADEAARVRQLLHRVEAHMLSRQAVH
jgi:hypothetical protein